MRFRRCEETARVSLIGEYNVAAVKPGGVMVIRADDVADAMAQRTDG